MSAIVTHDNATALWHDLIRDAEHRAGGVLGEDLESYLVFTLMRHLGDAPLAHRIMAIELLEALQIESARQRESELRDVGDRCLLIAGLYPELAKRRRVPLSYFVDLGQGAYDQLASQMRAAFASLYAELARAFARLVKVLIEVRRLSGEFAGLDPLDRHALAVRGAPEPAFANAIIVAGNERPN